MNRLSFRLVRSKDSDAAAMLAHVDGIALSLLVSEFERKRGYTDPSGGYFGAGPQWSGLAYHPTSIDYLLNNRVFARDENGYSTLMDCPCGCFGCWPFQAIVSYRDGYVIWSDFRNEQRDDRDYRRFGAMRFDAGEYRLALDSFWGKPKRHVQWEED